MVFFDRAASKGKSGQYFYYYKCKQSKHNNISVKIAHNQFDAVLELSLPARSVKKIRKNSNQEIEKELKNKSKTMAEKNRSLQKKRNYCMQWKKNG